MGDDEDANARLMRRRHQRAAPSRIEAILWECLRDRRFHNLKFKRQAGVGPYIADFYCERMKLVVEADGPHHGTPEARGFDRRRDQWMQERGLTVVRLAQDEILTTTSLALKRIEAALLKQIS